MDNLTHTLAGAVLARAGLGRRTPLAMPTLLLAANLPDLDVLAYLRDPLFALTFRRGWTHGVLAMAVLPLALAGGMAAWDRLVRRRRRPDGAPAPFRELLLLSFAGVLSHPLLDLLNTYGVRLLMPFSGRWFYGDTLFIVDPWLWGLLGLAWALPVVESRRDGVRPSGNGRARSARIIGGLAVLYIGMMFGLGASPRRRQREGWRRSGSTRIASWPHRCRSTRSGGRCSWIWGTAIAGGATPGGSRVSCSLPGPSRRTWSGRRSPRCSSVRRPAPSSAGRDFPPRSGRRRAFGSTTSATPAAKPIRGRRWLLHPGSGRNRDGRPWMGLNYPTAAGSATSLSGCPAAGRPPRLASRRCKPSK